MSSISSTEKVHEAAWLLDGGVHASVVAATLGVTAHALEMAARRAGRPDVARQLSAECKWMRARPTRRDAA